MERKIAFIDASQSGAAGDMFIAALLDLGADIKKIEKVLSSIKKFIGDFSIEVKNVKKGKHGIVVKLYNFKFERREIGYSEAARIIKSSSASPFAKSLALNCLKTLAQAEAKIHGEKLENVHLHDASDSIADFLGFAAAFEELGLDKRKIVCSQINLGRPFPATLLILKGAPVFGEGERELTTPTGASIIKNISHEFAESLPPMKLTSVGYGAGKAELEGRANMLTLYLGEALESEAVKKGRISVLETNIDDATGEVLGDAVEKLFLEGALDVCIVPCIMKKGRPGNIIKVICRREDEKKFSDALFELTGTLGVRVYGELHRYEAPRKIAEKKVEIFGKKYKIRFKNDKPEFEEIKKIAAKLKTAPIKILRSMRVL